MGESRGPEPDAGDASDPGVPPSHVSNTVSGVVGGHVVQVGEIHGQAFAPGGFANVGVHIGDVHVGPGSPVRSRYRELVRRIAPPELVGREDELAEMHAFCTGPATSGYWWWRAPAWAGKSALMAWFVLNPPPGVRVVSFFVTARLAGQHDRAAFLDSVLEQLLEIVDQPLPAFLSDTTREAHFLGLLADAADACARRGERLVLLVDGLDEDRGVTGTDFHSIAALLPAVLPDGARVIVSGRPHPPVPDDVPDQHPLRDSAIVRPLASSERAGVVAVDMRRELDRLLTGGATDQDVVGLLVASGDSLTAADLADLAGRPDWPAWRVGEHLRTVAGRSFVQLAEAGESYVLGHEELVRTAATRIGPERLEQYRERLHRWAEHYRELRWPPETPVYLLTGYHRMLAATHDVRRMIDCVTDSARHDRMASVLGGNRAAIAEMVTTQQILLAEPSPDLRTMALLNVRRYWLASRDSGIPIILPKAWAALGQIHRARSLAHSVTDHEYRCRALVEIADMLPAEDPRSARLLDEAMALAAEVDGPDGYWCGKSLVGTLAVHGHLDRADTLVRSLITRCAVDLDLELVASRAIEAGDLQRAESLIRLMSTSRHHTAESRFSMLKNPETPRERQGRLLADLVRAMTRKGDLRRATALANTIHDPRGRVTAWAALIEMASPRRARRLLKDVRAYVDSLQDPGDLDRAQAALVGCLAAAGHHDQAVSLCRQLPVELRLRALSALIVQATESGLNGGFVMRAAQAEVDLYSQISLLAEIASTLEYEQAMGVAYVALDRAVDGIIRHEPPRHHAMRMVAELFERLGDHGKAESVACRIEDPDQHDNALVALAKSAVHAGDIARAKRLVDLTIDRQRCGSTLGHLATELPDHGDFDEAEALVRALDQPAEALARLSLRAAEAGDPERAARLAGLAESLVRTAGDSGPLRRWLTCLVEPVGNPHLAARIARQAAEPVPAEDDLEMIDTRIAGWRLAAAAEAVDLPDLADDLLGSIEGTDARGHGLVRVARRSGSRERARELLTQAEVMARSDLRSFSELSLLVAVSACSAAVGDTNDALRLAEEVERRATDDPSELARLVETTVRLGREEWTDRLVAKIIGASGAQADGLSRGHALFQLVDSLAVAGDPDRAEAVARLLNDRYDRARARVEVAISLARQGDLGRATIIADDVTFVIARASVFTELAKHDPAFRAHLATSVAESLLDFEWIEVIDGLALLDPDIPVQIHGLLVALADLNREGVDTT